MLEFGRCVRHPLTVIECNPQNIDGPAMADWRQYEILNHVPNCGGYLLTRDVSEAYWRARISVPEVWAVALSEAGSSP